jgi:2-phospho-L-lactate/phosphoenolpyruvate guanylyltransferase
MRFGLLPAKSLQAAKTRLAPALTEDERRAVTVAMFEDVLEALRGATALDALAVVSSDSTLLGIAERSTAITIDEQEPRGLNGAVLTGTARCVELGATSVLVVLSDLPLVTSRDLDSLVARLPADPVVRLVRSHEGLGTNALLRQPPNSIPTRFGGRSFDGHLAVARAAGIPWEERELPAIAFDVDTVEDLERIRRLGSSNRTFAVAEQILGAPRMPRARSLG